MALGDRIGISDLVAEDHLTPAERAERGSYVGCIAGALSREEYLQHLAAAGFVEALVGVTADVAEGMHNAIIQAIKPGGPSPARTTTTALTTTDGGDAAGACCDTGTASTCCAPSAKSSCCHVTAATDRAAGQLRLPVTATDAGVDVAVVGAGQAGLAAGRALQQAGLEPMIIEAATDIGGSWSSYYDSLTLFSPARFSALPGMALPGRPGRYPSRDEITAYLRGYAARFDLPVRTGSRVVDVSWDGLRFHLTLPGGVRLSARALVAASGGFGRPHIPELPGLTDFTGTLLHAGRYRRPEPFAGQRVVVVGGTNSAVQIAVELARVGHVTLASRRPVRFRPQRPAGLDLHYWARWSGLEAARPP